MNWRTVSLRKAAWQLGLLGLGCGIWAGAGYEAVLGMAIGAWGANPPLFSVLLPGAAFGLLLGLTFATLDELLGHYPGRMLRSLGTGALLGLLSGALTLGPLGLIVPFAGGPALWPMNDAALWHWTLLPVALGVLAGVAAFASGAGIGQPRLGMRRALWGLAGGLGGGAALAAALAFLPPSAWIHLSGFGLWAAFLSLVVYWREKRFAARWLRVLTGPGEDRILPLLARDIRLGKLESNEIALPSYQEVYPVHCQMRWTGEHYQIVDDETGGMVMVNFRQVQEQVLKTGDLVKIGSALLQYGET